MRFDASSAYVAMDNHVGFLSQLVEAARDGACAMLTMHKNRRKPNKYEKETQATLSVSCDFRYFGTNQ
jgi:hypothetical protein